MKHITSKLLSLLLCLAMLMSMVPAAYAAGTEGTDVTEANGGASEQAAATTDAAKVGERGFPTLAAALDNAQDGATVTLLADVTEDVTINKTITLDLGGKTLTNTSTGKATISVTCGTVTVKNGTVIGGTSYYNIEVTKNSNANLTLEGVTATAGNTGSSMIDNWGTMTITSGTYSGGLDVVKSEEGSTLNISGGKFTLSYATNGYTGVIFAYGTTTITGGEFIQSLTTTGRWNHPQVVATGVVEGYPAITKITGGTFTNNMSGEGIFRGIGKGTSDNFEVSGGTFNKSVSDDFFKDGYFAMKNAGGTYDAAGPFAARVNSTAGYSTLAEAIAAAKAGDTVTLLTDVEVSEPITVNTAITLDLGGKTLTSTWAMQSNAAGAARYALVNNAKMKLTNGTFNVGQARGVGAYAGLTLSGITVTQKLTGGHACVAFCADGATYTVNKESVIKGAYSVSIFANNATVNISNSTLEGTGNTLYHNGSNYGLKLTVTSTTITSSGSCGVYISGSTSAQSNEANRNGIGGYQQTSFTNCTISGAMNGVEVKYTDLTLDGCKVSSTATGEPSYSQNNDGPAASGFAVVSTDNAMDNTTPKPEGTIIIKGNGSYTGLVGLGALESVKTNYTGFKDETIQVSGGTFSSEVKPEYCAPGFVPKANDDGTYGVEEYLPVEVWTGYTGTKVASYKTIAEAAAHLGDHKWIVIAKDYTLTEDFEIPEGVFLDVAKNATLTVAEGVTLTVAANAKRLGVRTDATLVNNGTIMVCGTSNTNGYVMVQDGGVLDTTKLSVPEDCFLDNNGSNYFATANENALYEITYTDGTVKKTADRSHVNKNATQVKLLKDVEVSSWVLSNVADNFVLDLGGHTLSGSKTSGSYVLYAGVNMTIKNGTIQYNAGSEKGAICVYNGATVTIDSTATIDGGSGIDIMMQGETPSHVVLNGTVTTTGAYGFASNGSANSDGNPDTCNITVNAGATIKASKGFAIYHPTLGTVTVNGGTISGHTGIEMCAGKLVVSGGSITSTGDNTDATGSQNAILDGAAISIINRNYPGGVPTAEITGGTIKATGTGMTVKAYDYKNDTVASWTDVSNYVNISGGTFSSIPDNMNALCAAGHIPFKNADGTYGVTRPSSGSSGSYDPTYSVSTPSKTENGSVTVSPKSASKGDTVTVTVKPDSGYVLETLTVTDKNGNELTLKDKGNGKYTFTMPAGKVEVKATFMEDNSVLNFFYDVPNDAYFYEAVKWAVKNGITNGVGDNLFAPGQPCTRAQIVTFLWRAAGSPAPKSTVSFADVPAGSYYAKAVAWAVENGITLGTGDGTFSPNATCTRAQSVTFMWRSEKSPAAGTANPFADVKSTAYYADAVLWAVKENITKGTTSTTFSPDADCTRAQIVTFLWRCKK